MMNKKEKALFEKYKKCYAQLLVNNEHVSQAGLQRELEDRCFPAIAC